MKFCEWNRRRLEAPSSQVVARRSLTIVLPSPESSSDT